MSYVKKAQFWFFNLHQTHLACINIILMLINIFIAIAIIAKVANDSLKASPVVEERSSLLQQKALLEKRSVKTFTNKGENQMETFMLSIHAPTEHIMIGSAAIVSRYWALTTALCAALMNKHPIHKVKFRGNVIMHSFGFYHETEKILIHPNYDPETFFYDVALAKVIEPFVFENEVKINIFSNMEIDNNQIFLMGFTYENNTLQRFNLIGTSLTFDYLKFSVKLQDNNTDICNFLPGVILVHKDSLIGSMDCLKNATINCSCFTANLNTFYDWIQVVIETKVKSRATSNI